MISCAAVALAAAALAPQSARGPGLPGQCRQPAGTVDYSRRHRAANDHHQQRRPRRSTGRRRRRGRGTSTSCPPETPPPYQLAGMTDYTVLNRIVPTDRDARDLAQRHVISQAPDGGATGGNVWFYSPGGIVVGANAMFDVGGLLLTSLDLRTASRRLRLASPRPSAKTRPAPAASSRHRRRKINAPSSSYVALIAPRDRARRQRQRQRLGRLCRRR